MKSSARRTEDKSTAETKSTKAPSEICMGGRLVKKSWERTKKSLRLITITSQ